MPNDTGFHDAPARAAMHDYIVRATREAIIAIDLDGVVTTWNPAATRLTGCAADEALGAPVDESLHLTEELLHERLRRATRGEDLLEHRHTSIERADGSRTPVDLSVVPIRVEGGPARGALTLIRDITEEVEVQAVLADVQARMADTQRLARIGDWIWDRAAGEVQWSAQLHELAGVSPIDFGGDLDAHLAAFEATQRDDLYRSMQAAADAQDVFETECVLVRPDGTRRWVYVSGEPEHDHTGRFVGLRGICQDVTERREALEALEEADRLKDEFLGIVSHELRTPLTSILGFGQLLETRAPDELHEVADIIVRNAMEMHDMVGRILDFSRARSGRLDIVLEDHDVDHLIDEVLPLVEPFVSDHEVVVARHGLRVHADADGVRRVLVNLLTNAAKFTPAGRQITVGSARAGDRVHLFVEDQGPGIPPDEVDAIFERFHRVGSNEVSYERGAGVGLSIVKAYTEAMEGQVWVENISAGGARFVVDLPGASS